MKELTRHIGSAIAEQLPGFHFEERQGRLIKLTDEGWQAIAIEVLPTSSLEFGKLAAYAQIRLDEVEKLYLPHHLYVGPKDAKNHATISVNCDSLIRCQKLVHEFPLQPERVEVFAESYAEALKADIIPWLERYSGEQALFEGLADIDPRNRIISDPLTRYPVLMAILAKRGDIVGFDSLAAEFQEWCKNRHALVYAPLASAMLSMRRGVEPIQDCTKPDEF